MKTMTRDQIDEIRITLPLPPKSVQYPGEPDEIEIYARFMRHMSNVPSSRMTVKILSSIQFTADIEGLSDAHVAKMLVDMGLRAPRMAFPAEFLEFADDALRRSGWEFGGPSAALLRLKNHWDRIGEDQFAGISPHCSLVGESVYA